MRNLKKILSLALALVMVLSMMVTASAAFEDQDMINGKYAEAVDVMAELEILQGDGTNFNPAGTLTRAQAAVILSKVISAQSDVKYFEGATKYTENPFTDVPAWAVPYVLFCYQNGAVGGRTATTYDPNAPVTGYEFAKMLLVAAGQGEHEDYVGDANKTWQVKVVEAANKKGVDLLAGLTITLKNPISREQAAKMALNAMLVGPKGTLTYTVVSEEYGEVETFTSAVEAHIYAAQLAEIPGLGTITVEEDYTPGENLLTAFGVAYKPGTADAYGRKADVYTFNNGTKYAYDKAYNVPAATVEYTNQATAKQVGTDLKGYSAYVVDEDTETLKGVSVYVDGEDVSAEYVNTAPADALVALTDANATVEVYTNSKKAITSIVVVNTHFDEVSVAENKTDGKEYVTIDGFTAFENTLGLKDKDVVAYTAYGSKLDTVTKLEGFTSSLTTYTFVAPSYTYYIDGAPYALVGQAATMAAEVVATMVEGELVFYAGANGTIVYVQEPYTAPTAPVVNNTFALVLRTAYAVTVKEGTGLLDKGEDTVTAEAVVELLLADGTVKQVPVALNVAAKANATLGLAAGDVYYTIGKQVINLGKYTELAGEEGLTLEDLDGKVVAYDDGIITFAKTALPTKGSDNVYAASSDTLLTSTPVVNGDILVNSNTTIVVAVYGDKNNPTKITGYKAVKGQAALDADGVDAEFVVYTATKTKTGYTKTALIVFAPTTDIKAAQAPVVNTGNYVFNTMTFAAKYDAEKEKWYNSYSMIKTDASYILVDVPAETEMVYGIYELLSDGSVELVVPYFEEGTTDFAENTGKVQMISENFVMVNGSWIQLSDKAVVAGTIEVGAVMTWYDVPTALAPAGDGLVDLVWVTVPAEA